MKLYSKCFINYIHCHTIKKLPDIQLRRVIYNRVLIRNIIVANYDFFVSFRISLFSQAGFQHVPLSVPKIPTIIEGAKLVAKYISNIVSMSVHQKF